MRDGTQEQPATRHQAGIAPESDCSHLSGFTQILLGGLLLSACANLSVEEERKLTSQGAAVLYGEDSRLEYYQTAPPGQRLVKESLLALMPASFLVEDGGHVAVEAEPLGSRLNLCETEAFLTQPTAAHCAGTLVAPDLVLSAGHCLLSLDCANLKLVQGYYYQAHDSLIDIEPNQIYSCAKVVAYELSDSTDQPRLDYAWLKLDRPVLDAQVVQLSDTRGSAPQAGAALTWAGFPDGVPAKVDQMGVLTDERAEFADFFTCAIDSFHGSSGAPVLNAQAELLGIAVRGANDYLPTDAGCLTTASLPVNEAQEEATYVHQALEGLCSDNSASAVEACCEMTGQCPPTPESMSCSSPMGTRTRGSSHAYYLFLLVLAALTATRSRN